jgi:ADP-heptose:LPS heptosyltransferase
MKVLFRRHGDGIGDWFLMLQALKHINRQHPDIECFIDFDLKPIGGRARYLPHLVRDAFAASDVAWKTLSMGKPEHGFDLEIPHVVYGRHRKDATYLEGMLEQLAEALDRELVCDPELVPEFRFDRETPWAERAYFAFQPQSKSETRWKEWGMSRFEELGARIHDELGLGVVQLGASDDHYLMGFPCDRFLGAPFSIVAAVLKGAIGFVGLENGIAVLASLLRVPSMICLTQHNAGRLTHVESAYKPIVDEVYAWCQLRADS